jgi:hypothetical protein
VVWAGWSVVGGGIGTLLVVVAVMGIWPQVLRLGRLDAESGSKEELFDLEAAKEQR